MKDYRGLIRYAGLGAVLAWTPLAGADSPSPGPVTNALAEAAKPWTLPPISQMPTTNRPVWPPPPPLDPYTAALQALDATTGQIARTQVPDLPRIFSLEPEAVTNQGAEAEQAEQKRVIALIKLSDALLRRGETAQALAQLSEALPILEHDSSRAFVLNRMGAYEFRLERYQEAIGHISEAIRLDPSSPAHAINLAAALLTGGKLDEALALLNALDPRLMHNPGLLFSLHFNLACAYSLKGDVSAGLHHLQEAAQASVASTLASLGDTQLDRLRLEPEFQRLRDTLERRITEGRH